MFVAHLIGCGGLLVPPGGERPDAAPDGQSSITCPEGGAPLALRLPCLLSPTLPGDGAADASLHLLECDLADSLVRRTVGFYVPLTRLQGVLNEEVRIPFEGMPRAPGYALAIDGTAVFTAVDSGARTLSGRLLQASIRSNDQPAGRSGCDLGEQPLRAVPGDFRR